MSKVLGEDVLSFPVKFSVNSLSDLASPVSMRVPRWKLFCGKKFPVIFPEQGNRRDFCFMGNLFSIAGRAVNAVHFYISLVHFPGYLWPLSDFALLRVSL